MALVLDIRTSLEFWRRVFPGDHTPKNPTPAPLAKIAKTRKDICAQAPNWLTPNFMEPYGGVLHIYVLGNNGTRSSDVYHTHNLPAGIPDSSFYALNNGTYIASPELVFLEAARILDPLELIALGDELCGLYRFDKNADRGFAPEKAPLTTTRALRSYLSQASGCHGVQKASRALHHVVERSASPMETMCEMLMCLPYRLGGYGLPKPSMNFEIPLTGPARRVAGQGTCYADICWPSIETDLEYLGYFDHVKAERAMADRARINGLRMAGYEVIELTSDQVRDVFRFEEIVFHVARKLGHYVKPSVRGCTPARLALRKTVRAWNANSGLLLSRNIGKRR